MSEETVRICDICRSDISDNNIGYAKRYYLLIRKYGPHEGSAINRNWDLCPGCWDKMRKAVGLPF